MTVCNQNCSNGNFRRLNPINSLWFIFFFGLLKIINRSVNFFPPLFGLSIVPMTSHLFTETNRALHFSTHEKVFLLWNLFPLKKCFNNTQKACCHFLMNISQKTTEKCHKNMILNLSVISQLSFWRRYNDASQSTHFSINS